MLQQHTGSAVLGNYPQKDLMFLIRQCKENEEKYHKRGKNLARFCSEALMILYEKDLER